tara:strand:- start:158 stop:766 length:609 start_codon:yes stop_codon:yes gene_type:complete
MLLTQEQGPQRGRPKKIDPSQTLEIAIQAYWSKGIDHMSINEVCRRANVSKPSVYREFGSEDGLLAAVLAEYQKVILENLESIFLNGDDFDKALNNLFNFLIPPKSPDYISKGCLYSKCIGSYRALGKQSKKELAEMTFAIKAIFKLWFERAKEIGELDTPYTAKELSEYSNSLIISSMNHLAKNEDRSASRRFLEMGFSIF